MAMMDRPRDEGRRPAMRARKRYGQHFLQAPWADRLIAAVEPQPEDRFLEIGPGPRALTTRLARRGGPLAAGENDRDMVEALLPGAPPNVTIVPADILAFDIAS